MHDVPAAGEAGEDGAAVAGRAPVFHGHDLGEQHAGVLAEHLAGLAGDGHAERAEVLGEDARVGVEVERPLSLPHDGREAAAGVDLAHGAAGVDDAPRH